MAGEKDKHAVVSMNVFRIGHGIAKHRENLFSGRLLVEQRNDMVWLEAEVFRQQLAHRAGIVNGVVKTGPFGIIVDADDHRPAFTVEGWPLLRFRSLGYAWTVVDERFAIPGKKAETFVLQGLDNQ